MLFGLIKRVKIFNGKPLRTNNTITMYYTDH